MDALIDRLSNMSRSQRLGIMAAIVILVGAVMYFLFYNTYKNTYDAQREKVKKLEDQLLQKKVLGANYAVFMKEVQRLEQELKEALAMLPNKSEIPELLRTISNFAQKAGCEIVEFKPEEEEKKDFYVRIPISLKLKGTYHEIAIFFDFISKLKRIVNVSQISFKNPTVEKQKVILEASCLATTFRYKD